MIDPLPSSRTMMMETRIVKRNRHAASLMLAAFFLLAEPASAEDSHPASRPSDGSNERLPAVTAFPKYPSQAWRDRVEGETTVCFFINERGEVVEPSVRRSTHRIFEKPSMQAIRRSSFAPLDGEKELAVEKTCRTYRYRLSRVNDDSMATAEARVDQAEPLAAEARGDD